jgi:coatomer subunit beta'
MQSGFSFEIMAPLTPVKSLNSEVKFLKLIVRKQWFLVGTSDGFVQVCSYGTRIQQITSFRASKSSLTSIAIHPTEPYVLSSAEDSSIKLWNWDKGWECTQTYEDEHSRTIRQVIFNPKDTDTFASASSDHTVKVSCHPLLFLCQPKVYDMKTSFTSKP